ncbi:MAG: DUF4270 family protein [Bacteroidetes bacterium]|nr:MAG: DUF4270 family protein [Bacteroidota bacterium]
MARVNWLKDNLSIIGFSCIVFFACTRGSDEVNKTVRPDSQQFTTKVTDTFTVKTSTILFDSSISNNSFRSLIGSYYNSDFGKVTSEAYLQFLPETYKNTLGPNPKFDSLFLELQFSSSLINPINTTYSYGSNNDIQNFNVRRLNEDISSTTLYYNNSSFDSPIYLGAFQLSKNKLISAPTNTISGIVSYIKVPLSDALGQEFIAESQTFLFANQANFFAKFKGLYIQSLSGNTCIWGIQSAKIILKYHNYFAANDLKVSDVYNLKLTSIRSQLRNLTTDRSTSALAGLTKNYDEISGTDCYVQANTGVCTKISFPSLLDFKKRVGVEKLVVNRAELEITPDLSNAGAYPVPTNLFFYEFDKDGKCKKTSAGLPSIKTANSEGEIAPGSYFLSYNSTANNYIVKRDNSDDGAARPLVQTANITRFVQSILDGNTDPNESLVLASDGKTFYPVTLDRSGIKQYVSTENYAEVNQLKFKSNKEGIKLRIFYTAYP